MHLAALLRKIALTARSAHPEAKRDQLLTTAGVLYATARQILEKPNAELLGYGPHQFTTPDEFLEALSRFPDTASEVEIFGACIDGLASIDNYFKFSWDVYGAAFPVDLAKHAPLLRRFGIVRIYFRPKSILPRLRKERYDSCPNPPLNYPALPCDRTYYLAFSLSLDDSRHGLARARFSRLLNVPFKLEVFARDGYRVALFPLSSCPLPNFQLVGWEGSRVGFFSRQETAHDDIGADALNKELLTAMAEAMDSKANIVVFPELSLTTDLVAETRKFLVSSRPNPFDLVVAGSFHTWENGKSLPFNRATVLDGSGNIIWHHDKRGYFDAPSRLLGQAPREGVAPLHPLPPRIPEAIEYGIILHYVDTPLGRLAVLICADLLDDRAEGWMARLLQLRPDLLFVACMTSKISDFEASFHKLRKHGIGALLVNAGSMACPSRTALALISMGFADASSAPKNSWKWASNGDLYYLDRGRRETWKKLDRSPSVPSVYLTSSGKGLLVNVGSITSTPNVEL